MLQSDLWKQKRRSKEEERRGSRPVQSRTKSLVETNDVHLMMLVNTWLVADSSPESAQVLLQCRAHELLSDFFPSLEFVLQSQLLLDLRPLYEELHT